MKEVKWLKLATPDELIRFASKQANPHDLQKPYLALLRVIKGLIQPLRAYVDEETLSICDVLETICDGKVSPDEWLPIRSQINVTRVASGPEVAKVALYSTRFPTTILIERDPRELVHFLSEFLKSIKILASSEALQRVGPKPEWAPTGHQWHELFEHATKAARRMQANIIRCLFNPFRRTPFDPRWLSSSVLDLANSIYEERAFDRMPILGDALMDAGCADEQILQHCSGPGPHVRGCWVVDLMLGKS